MQQRSTHLGEWMLRPLILASLLAGACATDEAPTAPLDPATPAPEVPVDDDGPEDPPPATNGWRNTPIPFVAYHHDVTVAFTLDWRGGEAMAAPIDAVVGLADGMATDIADLGPLVRLGPEGFVEVRDGGAYRADARVDYRGQPVAIVMRVNLEQRRYGVEANGVAIASAYAFNDPQGALTRIDTLAFKATSADAVVEARDVTFAPRWCSLAATSWVNIAYPQHAGSYRVRYEVEVPASLDAVIGLSSGDAAQVSDLAAAVRFNPNGTLEARDGDRYAAAQAMPYAAYTIYRVTMEVDVAAKRYSVYVAPEDDTSTGPQLAASYAFATSQRAATTLSQLAMATTGPGYVRLCDLTVWDY